MARGEVLLGKTALKRQGHKVISFRPVGIGAGTNATVHQVRRLPGLQLGVDILLQLHEPIICVVHFEHQGLPALKWSDHTNEVLAVSRFLLLQYSRVFGRLGFFGGGYYPRE